MDKVEIILESIQLLKMSDEEYFTFIKGKLSIKDEGNEVKLINESPNNIGWCNNFRGFIPYRYLCKDGNFFITTSTDDDEIDYNKFGVNQFLYFGYFE